jgi:hypothetical protein
MSIVASENLWQFTAGSQLSSDVIYLYSAGQMQLAGQLGPSNADLRVACDAYNNTVTEKDEVF